MESSDVSADDAWERMQTGNHRWVERRSAAGNRRAAARRAATSLGQNPFAMVLSCADSRLPVEILFDQGIGDLFVVRTAGHSLDTAVLGSLEYGVEVLGVSLIVVLGHESCGAVAAAIGVADGVLAPPGHIGDIARSIVPHVQEARRAGAETADEIAGRHSLITADLLRERSEILDEAIRERRLAARAAHYSISSGLAGDPPSLSRIGAGSATGRRPD
jgi:carbonic anhydrase